MECHCKGCQISVLDWEMHCDKIFPWLSFVRGVITLYVFYLLFIATDDIVKVEVWDVVDKGEIIFFSIAVQCFCLVFRLLVAIFGNKFLLLTILPFTPK